VRRREEEEEEEEEACSTKGLASEHKDWFQG
jgi:hypothetical protein